MSVFEDAFSSAAATMMTVFGEKIPATYTPVSGTPQNLTVVVDRGVKDSDMMTMTVNPSVIVSWLKSDRSQHTRGDVIVLNSGEQFRLNKLDDDDGIFISYQVIKA